MTVPCWSIDWRGKAVSAYALFLAPLGCWMETSSLERDTSPAWEALDLPRARHQPVPGKCLLPVYSQASISLLLCIRSTCCAGLSFHGELGVACAYKALTLICCNAKGLAPKTLPQLSLAAVSRALALPPSASLVQCSMLGNPPHPSQPPSRLSLGKGSPSAKCEDAWRE